MNNKIVLCDADDVIENLLECWVNEINIKYGTNVSVNDITSWGLAPFFPTLTEFQVYSPLYDDHIFSKIDRIPGCFPVLKEINNKHTLYIVTASNHETINAKVKRILELYPFLDWTQFIVASNKQMVHGDYLIDNGQHNLIGGDYQGILYNMPHNADFNNEQYGIIRVYNWEEIAQILL